MEKSHKDFCDIGSVSDYSSGYLEEEIDDIDYEKIQTIRFLVEIDDEDDNELANSKIVTLSCNTEDESFTVESIADYEEEADISEDEDIVDDFEKNSLKKRKIQKVTVKIIPYFEEMVLLLRFVELN